MAGDWIKMRTNLWDDPRVSRLCDITGQTEAAIIGGLYWLWSAADEHTEDGIMVGLSVAGIDRKTGVKGLGIGLVEIGWIAEHPEGIQIVRFDEHNGASAKKRILTARRVANFKAGNAEVTPEALPDEQQGVTGELPARDLDVDVDVDVEKSKPIKPKSKAVGATATRLPADWMPSPTDLEFCRTKRPDLNAIEVAAAFRDYWTAQGGAKGRKLDWAATWRNWIRNEKTPAAARASPARPINGRQAAIDNYAAQAASARGETYGQPARNTERDITGEAFVVT